jgi:predicted deacylase
VSGPARLDLDPGTPGRTTGALRLPWSHDGSAYGQLVVPVTVLNGGRGPTALLTAGIHGDEYEGQIALARLARELDPARLAGRLVIVPTALPPAALAGRRTSPVDGGNLARLFPGDPAGPQTAQLAEGIVRLLLALADLVVDLHSGGSTLEYLPCAWGRLPADPGLAARTLDLLVAFDAPLTAVVRRPEARGTLVATALEAGIPAIATELGGGGGVTPSTVAAAVRGVRRVLAAAGILPPAEPARGTRLLAVEGGHFVRAPGRGLFEPTVALGDRVPPGGSVGVLHDPERPGRETEAVHATDGGLAICRRVPAMAAPGDVLLHTAADVTRDALLAG